MCLIGGPHCSLEVLSKGGPENVRDPSGISEVSPMEHTNNDVS